MCYTGACEYEAYPWGYNEGCVCRKPQCAPCPHEEEDEVETLTLDQETMDDAVDTFDDDVETLEMEN